jgi:hypothetical protein
METGIEVNADKIKYMVMSQDQNGGRSKNMKIDNSSLKGWKCFNIWEKLSNRNPIQEKLRAD